MTYKMSDTNIMSMNLRSDVSTRQATRTPINSVTIDDFFLAGLYLPQVPYNILNI